MKPVLLIYVISNHQDFQEMFKCSFMYPNGIKEQEPRTTKNGPMSNFTHSNKK